MLADPLPILLVFAAGQAAALWYLRTGRFLPGFVTTTALWLSLDWWMLARFVFEATPTSLRAPALSLWLSSLAAVVTLGYALLRRRRGRALRRERFAAALHAHLRNDHAAARRTLQQLVWHDPWDAAAWLLLGDVLRREQKTSRALRCYRRAAALDTQNVYEHLLQHRRRVANASARRSGTKPDAAGMLAVDAAR